MNNSTIAIIVIVVILVIIFGAFGIYEVTKTSPTTPPPILSSAGYDGPADPLTVPPMPTAPPTTTPSPSPIVPTPSPGSITPNVSGTRPTGTAILGQNQFLTQGDNLISTGGTYILQFAGANDPGKQPQGQIYITSNTGDIMFTFFAAANVNPNNMYFSVCSDGILRCFDKNLITILTVSPKPGVLLAISPGGYVTLYSDVGLTVPVWSSLIGSPLFSKFFTPQQMLDMA